MFELIIVDVIRIRCRVICGVGSTRQLIHWELDAVKLSVSYILVYSFPFSPQFQTQKGGVIFLRLREVWKYITFFVGNAFVVFVLHSIDLIIFLFFWLFALNPSYFISCVANRCIAIEENGKVYSVFFSFWLIFWIVLFFLRKMRW